MSEDASSSVNVIVVAFVEDADAYEALTTLKELDSQDQTELRSAAVVKRAENGEIVNKDQITDDHLAGSAAGGILGLLIGILDGPFGVLIGGATGGTHRVAVRFQDACETESVIAEVAAAEHAHREAKRTAHKELLKSRHHKHVEQIRAKLAELRAKLDRHKQGATAGS